MPYIPSKDRDKLDPRIDGLFTVLKDQPPGELNYSISKLIWKLFEHEKSYSTIATLVGTLVLVIFEFVRRKVNTYEDTKIIQNGDISV